MSGGGFGAEKRQHERIALAFPMIVKEGDRRLGTIEDISAGGLRVRLDEEVGENEEVREWTGAKGADNKIFVLESLVGQEFEFTIMYMAMTMGSLKARLIRVIRIMKHVFFAMQFTEADPAVVEKIMSVVKRRAAKTS